MRTKLVIAFLVVILTAVVCTLWFLPGRGIRTHTVRTLQLKQNVLIDFDLLQESDARQLADSIQSETNALELNRRIAGFLRASTDPYITNSAALVSDDGLYRDAWGTPLNFCTTNSPVYLQLKPEAKGGKPTPFVLWSSGPNQTNELCFGDDLFLHR